MAKTLADYVDLAEHAVRGRLDERIDTTDLVNEAGRHLVAMHEWKFLERPTLNVDFVADQSFVELPRDFGRAISVEVPNSLQTTVQFSTLSEVEFMRGSSLHDPFRYHVAITAPAQNSIFEEQPGARMEIWPAPATTETSALKVVYLAGWLEMVDYDAVANIPVDVEVLLVSLIQALAKSYANPNSIVGEALSLVGEMSFVNQLKQRYGLVQGNLGQMSGTLINTVGTMIYRPHTTISGAV